MGRSGWNAVVLVAVAGLWIASGTQREKPVLAVAPSANLLRLEGDVAARPSDPRALRDLAQAYLDAHSPGLAMSLIEHAPIAARLAPRVDHTYARALLDQGRAEEALAIEQRVMGACAASDARESNYDTCDTWLIASATRRVGILRELVLLGVEDAQAHPEESAIAYQNATREARLANFVE
jgi:hypothetical protein